MRALCHRTPKNRWAPVERPVAPKWVAERGCAFDQHATGQTAHGIASVTAHREGRKAVIPLIGSRKRLDPRQVKEIVETLGLDPSEPGRKGPVLGGNR
jgi:hypothetical protein